MAGAPARFSCRLLALLAGGMLCMASAMAQEAPRLCSHERVAPGAAAR
ncbi:hypothetical protein RAA17_06540 [Komagataeibacter rhaeticus]|nr:hypothetical protein [Komagataeibacter rhaeticus]